MSDFIHAAGAQSFAASLTSLAVILGKALAHPEAATLPGEKLAPDMFPLSFQVQVACHHALSGSKRLAGRDPGSFTRKDLDLAALQALAAETAAALADFAPADFAGAETRLIEIKLQPPKILRAGGDVILNRWLLPNFYFHVVTAYDILRHKGVEIGKQDYLSHLAPYMHQG